ncbi:hypothetical protein FHT86_006939 [Rhizobium sp. BK313]|jgi:hypothetical protein|uniref:curli assembly protein CsgF n=1 Tax=Rhizobium sp. BK313 TaxID=2587081 RepID=UPI0010623171|nr:curli assembly protein CsgF [Rhizobium sp. BK313]MBB3458613.1 hypothetical protein [Rhizobium sp. BK313]
MRVINIAVLTVAIAAMAGAASASQLVYKPVNPAFGGDPQNGSWLLSQASAQGKAAEGSSSPGFSIDFPDFGNTTQPTNSTTTNLPDVNTNTNTTPTN